MPDTIQAKDLTVDTKILVQSVYDGQNVVMTVNDIYPIYWNDILRRIQITTAQTEIIANPDYKFTLA